jgi:hypothetical protein
MLKIDLIYLIIIAIFSFTIGIFFSYKLYKFIKSNKIKKRFKKSKIGEFEAKSYLKNLGFTIIAEQVPLTSSLLIDNKRYNYEVKADYLVQKRNKKAVVEVKTGREAANPLNINTRRQILEYMLLYNVDKVFLFDAQNKKLKEMKFIFNKLFISKHYILIGIIIGILISLFIIMLFNFLFKIFLS